MLMMMMIVVTNSLCTFLLMCTHTHTQYSVLSAIILISTWRHMNMIQANQVKTP